MSTTDRIERQVVLSAPLARVWSAVGDSTKFGEWFGMRLEGPFVPGRRLKATVAATVADPAIAKMQEPYAGTPFEIVVERVEPPHLLAFRWHPFGVDKATDPDEPMTLVELRLEAAGDGTRLTMTESGFDALPLERRAKAFQANEGGWTMQCQLVAKYLATGRA
jgi:uncharacterized protein YndB with AHSA1/START domain